MKGKLVDLGCGNDAWVIVIICWAAPVAELMVKVILPLMSWMSEKTTLLEPVVVMLTPRCGTRPSMLTERVVDSWTNATGGTTSLTTREVLEKNWVVREAFLPLAIIVIVTSPFASATAGGTGTNTWKPQQPSASIILVLPSGNTMVLLTTVDVLPMTKVKLEMAWNGKPKSIQLTTMWLPSTILGGAWITGVRAASTWTVVVALRVVSFACEMLITMGPGAVGVCVRDSTKVCGSRMRDSATLTACGCELPMVARMLLWVVMSVMSRPVTRTMKVVSKLT
mmetsp:Transcript_21141/g.49543  ORF Transcript_21141/g.49543 Transcript_21141/m.49543 type:complete len:281 (-) Transcript_21141:8213-9055(-)